MALHSSLSILRIDRALNKRIPTTRPRGPRPPPRARPAHFLRRPSCATISEDYPPRLCVKPSMVVEVEYRQRLGDGLRPRGPEGSQAREETWADTPLTAQRKGTALRSSPLLLRYLLCGFTSSSVPDLTARTSIFHSSTLNFTRLAPSPMHTSWSLTSTVGQVLQAGHRDTTFAIVRLPSECVLSHVPHPRSLPA